MKNRYKKTIIAPLLFTLSIALIFAENVDAVDSATDTTTFQVSITDFLTLTLDQTDNIAHISPNVRFNTGSIVASVSTNNTAGYILTFQDVDDRNGLERDGYVRASSEDKPQYNIPSVATDTEYTNLVDDTWGYYLGAVEPTLATYRPIPIIAKEINSSDTPVTADSSKVGYGVKISATRASGVYKDTLYFSAVAIPLPIENPFDIAFSAAGKTKDTTSNKYKMQDMTASICDAVSTPTAPDYSDTPETQLVDTRDGKLYWVAKLKDGKCWMTQNLDLDLIHMDNDAEAKYTHDNTDLGWGTDITTTRWNPERSTIPAADISYVGEISGWADSETDPYSVDTGNWYWTDEWYGGDCGSQGCNYISGNSNGKFSQTPTGSGMHGHVGNYYNWTASIASNDSSSYTSSTYADNSGNPQNSICPAGWRLPTIYNSSTDSRNEFRYLLSQYDAIVTSGSERDRALAASPLWLVRGGYIYSDILYYLYSSGHNGRYWSSTIYSLDSSYSLLFASGSINLATSGARSYGYSVRCVARGVTPDPDPSITTFDEAYAAAGKTKDTTTDKYKINDMTSSICSAITTDQISELVDVRDNTVYHVGKMQDRHCWLLDNLALDAVATKANLAPENTNATQAAIDNFKTDSGIAPQSGWATTAVSYETGPSVSDQPRIIVTSKDVVPQGIDPLASTAVSEGWKVGAYYNYCAASIGTYCYDSSSGVDTDSTSSIDIKNDICPAGWRMPTGSSYDAISRPDGGEYLALYNAYPATSGGDNQYTKFRKALRLPFSGYSRYGAPDNQGLSAGVWSSTFYDENHMYYLHADPYDIAPQDNTVRSIGLSVRCVAK